MANTQKTEHPVSLFDRVVATGWIAEDIAEFTGLDFVTVEHFFETKSGNSTTLKMLERFLKQRAMFA